jgi:hypothetical protein
MASGKIPGVRNVSKKEARELSKLPWTADDEVLSQIGQARVLPDGRVLLCDLADGSGTLFPSRAAAEEMNRRCAETERQAAMQTAGLRRPDIETLLPPVDDFLRDVEAHAQSLGPRLRIPDEVLDFSPASLGAVDRALKRIPWAERQVPDLVTPLVAYIGEVLRRASGGRWVKHSRKDYVSVCDPDELLALWAAKRKLGPSARAAADKAKAEATARGASAYDADVAYSLAGQAIMAQAPEVKSRVEEREDNEPVIVASNRQSFQPFAIVFVPMVEPSKRLPLRAAVETALIGSGYRAA